MLEILDISYYSWYIFDISRSQSIVKGVKIELTVKGVKLPRVSKLSRFFTPSLYEVEKGWDSALHEAGLANHIIARLIGAKPGTAPNKHNLHR